MVTYRTAIVTPHADTTPITFEIHVAFDLDHLYIEAPRDALFPHPDWLPASFDMTVLDHGSFAFYKFVAIEQGWCYKDRQHGFTCLAAKRPLPKWGNLNR